MPVSTLSWLDYSEKDRQKAQDVIDLFRDQGTVDELGIGTIRDSFADQLFPGTSTIQTRVHPAGPAPPLRRGARCKPAPP